MRCVASKDDQDFLPVLWFKDNDPNGSIVPCRMTRSSFGLLCAQSGVLFCLERMLLENERNASAETIVKALLSFYVDEGLFSFGSEFELIMFLKKSFLC